MRPERVWHAYGIRPASVPMSLSGPGRARSALRLVHRHDLDLGQRLEFRLVEGRQLGLMRAEGGEVRLRRNQPQS